MPSTKQTKTHLEYFCDDKRHLVCVPFSIENLHDMAFDLGIGRHWYHAGKHPHYDIPVRRYEEIAQRCTVVSSREIWKIVHG